MSTQASMGSGSQPGIPGQVSSQQQQQMVVSNQANMGNDVQPGIPVQLPSQQQQQWLQKQHLLAMQRQQPPLYTPRSRPPNSMNYNPHQQNFHTDGGGQYPLYQQQQLLLQSQQLKQQIVSPNHPPMSPQQSLMGHPQAVAPVASPQQLLRSPPSVRSPQPIPSPHQQHALSPHHSSQTHSPRPTLNVAVSASHAYGVPDQIISTNDMMLTQLSSASSSHSSMVSQNTGNPEPSLSRDELTPQEQLNRFVENL
ncbi:CREB-binding protein-like [Limulus polyphemus]|uniref:CREB-binding protein-like n=1 Tax=Limulus polyphemus TaxID=6850 RepID=A0ABM1BC74_LIMPO|nr:CREB-binding protein-like [Limulus polyphemus]